MRRMIISVVILCGMILLSIYFGYTITKGCDSIVEIIELAEEHIRNDEKELALEDIKSFKKEWDKLYNKGVMMINGERLNEIQNCYTRIIPLIETDNDELLPELEELKGIFIYMKQMEKPILRNIF